MTNSTMSTVTRVGSNRAGAFVDMSQSISAGVANIGRPVTMIQAVANGVSAFCRRFMAGLHETRRQQAALVLLRYRHLICEDDTNSIHKTNATTDNRK